MLRRAPRVYADTSVFGGIDDQEFAELSQWFFRRVVERRYHLVTSGIVQDEINDAPVAVQAFFDEMLGLAELIETPTAAFELRNAYLAQGVVTERRAADALHVAIAAVSGCFMIVSWNFKHIVNSRRIALYNAVNEALGYQSLAIQSPQEVRRGEDESL